MNFSIVLNKNYALDINLCYKYRDFADGVDFVDFRIIYDRYKADHKHSFDIWFRILNFVIFEFNIYNIYHIEEI